MANPITLKYNNIIQINHKLLYSRFLTTTPIKRNDAGKEITESVAEKPLYATAQDFKNSQNRNKFRGCDDSSCGHKPSNFQKHEIPEYLTSGTMNKLSDQFRVSFIIVGCIAFFAIALLGGKITAARIERDKKVGVVVTKM
uniref:Ovule protein n=1 Tax=Strongyloides papillosus TaxID=174720 RepID=A0A0N5C3Y8_STREA